MVLKMLETSHNLIATIPMLEGEEKPNRYKATKKAQLIKILCGVCYLCQTAHAPDKRQKGPHCIPMKRLASQVPQICFIQLILFLHHIRLAAHNVANVAEATKALGHQTWHKHAID